MNNRLELRRIASEKILERWRRFVDDLQERGSCALTFEGQHKGEQLKQHDPGRKNISPSINLSAIYLFRRHVADAANNLARASNILVAEMGDAKINDLHTATLTNHDVGGLDVTVYYPAMVGIAQTAADLNHQIDPLYVAELTAG